MKKFFCSKIIEFEAAHRIIKHKGKCKNLHGHRYIIEITLVSTGLDELGMVLDFAIIKDILGGWIKDNWDHNVILENVDRELGDSIAKVTKQKIFYLNSPPTAECLARYIYEEVCPTIFNGYNAYCSRIKLSETSTSYVEICSDCVI